MTVDSITLDEFKARIWEQLRDLPGDTEIVFGTGDLTLYRCKTRLYRADNKTPKIVQIEFNQLYEILEK
jgi:hypothetical protein